MNSPCINCGADVKVCKECDWYNEVWISKAEYEARLKDDMVTMFKELQMDFDEIAHYRTKDDLTLVVDMSKVNDIIQQKIDALKAESKIKDGMSIDR